MKYKKVQVDKIFTKNRRYLLHIKIIKEILIINLKYIILKHIILTKSHPIKNKILLTIVFKVLIENIYLMTQFDKVIIRKTVLGNIFLYLIIKQQSLNLLKKEKNLNRFPNNSNNQISLQGVIQDYIKMQVLLKQYKNHL